MRTEKKFVKTTYYPQRSIVRSLPNNRPDQNPKLRIGRYSRKRMRTYRAPTVLCEIGLKRDKIFDDTPLSPQSSYVSRTEDRVRRGFSLFKETWGLSVCSKRAARPPRRPPSTSAILMPGFFLNVLLLFQLPSLLPVTVVSVRPWRLKRARQQNFLRPLKVR